MRPLIPAGPICRALMAPNVLWFILTFFWAKLFDSVKNTESPRIKNQNLKFFIFIIFELIFIGWFCRAIIVSLPNRFYINIAMKQYNKFELML